MNSSPVLRPWKLYPGGHKQTFKTVSQLRKNGISLGFPRDEKDSDVKSEYLLFLSYTLQKLFYFEERVTLYQVYKELRRLLQQGKNLR